MKSFFYHIRTFLLPAIGLLLFVLFSFFPVRLDMSKNSAYTLSPSTRKIITSVKKPVTITLYASSDLPTRIIPLKNDVSELLQEYRRGGKNITVTTVDPKKDTKIGDKLKELGIPQLQFSQLEQNKYQTSSFYFGIALTYKDKNEVIPQVSDYQNLEYNITSAIYRLTRETAITVGIVGENPQMQYGQQDPLSSLKKVMSQQYSVSSLDLKSALTDTDAFMKANDALIVFERPEAPYSTEEINLLKKFYESGKSLLVFANGVSIDERTLEVAPSTHNLNELTATYGATINTDLVLSTSAEYVNFGNETSQFLAPYPFWIRTNIFNTKTGLFSNLQFVSFPWASSLSLKDTKKASLTPLISSSNRSWIQKGEYVLNPNTIPQPRQTDVKEYLLGAVLTNKKGGELIVIPSSRFVLDQYMGRGSGNLDFALNAVDVFSSQGSLSGIRSRIVSFYPLPDMADAQKELYKYTAILLFPLIWGIYGVVQLIRRK